ncbi:MAG: tetraacyldisaccharide 4'-kinase [Luteitalea sp.]|nr:tetraacyldisaccharide 4'-kinase [Luteitalea sp.]
MSHETKMTGVLSFSSLYAVMARRRRRWYRAHPDARRTLHRPVISVGNIAVGGRRKTPIVAALARWLIEKGERPAILSRGYAREQPRDGVVVVRDAERVLAPLTEAGDEPFLLAQNLTGCAVVVCADRYLAGRLAESRLGCTVHLLDDGFQHFALARDVDLVAVDPQDVTAARVLPHGRLRESPDVLDVADALIWLGAAHDTARDRPSDNELRPPQFIARDRHGVPRPLASSLGVPALAPPARVVGVAATAEPERFFDHLRAAGWALTDALGFPDHHPFSQQDLGRVATRMQETGAVAVLTTEKDGVRLDARGELPFPAAVVPLAVDIEPREAFFSWLAGKLEAAGHKVPVGRGLEAPRPAAAERPCATSRSRSGGSVR